MRDVGESPAPKAIRDRKVLQGHKALKAFKECRAPKDRRELKVLRGRRALLVKRVRGAKRERKGTRATKAIPVRGIRETGAIKVTRAMPVHQYALFRSMDN